MKMSYIPKRNPKRGLIIEKFQPPTNQDIDLIKRVLDENDEVVLVIGDAGNSHEPAYNSYEDGNIMTGGERILVLDYALQNANIDPNRYIIIPIENRYQNTEWVGEIRMLTPKWDTFYTRNYKNSKIFDSFKRGDNFSIETIVEQKKKTDFFKLLSESTNKNDLYSSKELNVYIPESVIHRMKTLGIDDRVNVIYNREVPKFDESKIDEKRELFIGRMNPFTGFVKDKSGHLGVIANCLDKNDQVVLAFGSSQKDLEDRCPLSAGERIDIVRYSLIRNGIDASKFYTVPIKDTLENSIFPYKIQSLCPNVQSICGGNDYVNNLFSHLKVNEVKRTPKSGVPISATLVRNTTLDVLNDFGGVTVESINECENQLRNYVDKFSLEKLRDSSYYNTIYFLGHAKD
jgi:nicotinamide-nucleotide adenylyltransferase